MRGVHRKVEEPPRWSPTLTPIQQRLQKRFSISASAYLLGAFIVNFVMNLLDPPLWVWAAVASLSLSLFAALVLMMRALARTGPPFDHVRWWWPWRFPRT